MIREDCCSNTHRVIIFVITLIFFLHGLCGVLFSGFWLARNLTLEVLLRTNELVTPQEAAMLNKMMMGRLQVEPINTAVIGGIEVYIALLICCASCCELKKMLRGLCVVCIFFVIHNVVLISMALVDMRSTKELVRPLTKTFLFNFWSLYSEVTDYNISSTFTFKMNGIQVLNRCCGVRDYRDYANASQWKGVLYNQTVPESCCVLNRQLYLFSNLYMFPRGNCAKDPTPHNSFMKQGCVEPILKSRIRQLILLVMVWGSVSIFLYLFTFILIVCQMRRFWQKTEDAFVALRNGRFLEETTEQFMQQMTGPAMHGDEEVPAEVDHSKKSGHSLGQRNGRTSEDGDGHSHSLMTMFWRLGGEGKSTTTTTTPDVHSMHSRL